MTSWGSLGGPLVQKDLGQILPLVQESVKVRPPRHHLFSCFCLFVFMFLFVCKVTGFITFSYKHITILFLFPSTHHPLFFVPLNSSPCAFMLYIFPSPLLFPSPLSLGIFFPCHDSLSISLLYKHADIHTHVHTCAYSINERKSSDFVFFFPFWLISLISKFSPGSSIFCKENPSNLCSGHIPTVSYVSLRKKEFSRIWINLNNRDGSL